ncbi:hypothetical protein VKT23_017423 [Stygiomarasmius scandens]|uniref:Protein kinase domain-containing protein n=1 Tax=Marasmiellus scandens TaxID=2682957 RepID=A0ABR1ITV6_9AGAR
MATPYKLRAINADKNQSSLRPLLRADLDAQIYTGIDIQEFVQKVWSIADEECEQVLSKDWKIDPLLEAKYNRLITMKSSEPYYYAVFQQIAHDLLKRFLPSLGLTGDIMFWESFGKTYVGSLKPDMLILWLRMQEPTWCNTKVPVEFKNVAVPDVPKFTLNIPPMPASLPEGHVAKNSNTQRAISSMDAIFEHKRHRILPLTPMVTVDETEEFDGQQPAKAPTQQSIGSGIAVYTQPSASPAPPASGTKRKRDRKDEGRQPQRRAKKSSLTVDETQLASYALECFMANNRFYAPALFIDKWFMTLWYFDRMGAILSTTFDFKQQPKLLGLVLYALNNSSPQQSGFNHFLCRKEPLDASHLPPDVMKNARFQLPCHPPSDVEQHYRIFDVVGDPLYAYRGIAGRGSAVYSVSEILGNGSIVPNLVLKFSWPSIHRATESTLLSQLLERCPELQPHLPDLVFTAEYNSEEELKLPRFAMRSSKEWTDDKALQFEHRNLVALVTRRYQHLWDVKTIVDFQAVFIDFVECHHRAYITGRVLHRDLSENNLMVRHDNDGRAKGVLNDWDLSSKIDEEGNVPTSDAKHRTGTLPFLALDLLRTKPEHHLYRHDLESFLYVLLWAGLHYRLDGKRNPYPNEAVRGWISSDFKVAIAHKESLLSFKWQIDQLLGAFTPEFKPLAETWGRSLLNLFKVAYRDKDDNEDDESWDKETMGGYLTFENFMKALKSKPRSWE